MKTVVIRQKFIDFFVEKSHVAAPGSSVIPQADPSLLFTNAGMNQFKDIFLGIVPPSALRVVTAQRCIRAGGKHNDLSQVGFTKRHLTSFEMLGNFSFGNYFKKEAIVFAWEFLTNVVNLPKEKLWVTVFYKDDEAFFIWKDVVGIDEKKIVRLGEKDNFWQMGETGPCGPCSEIYYDRGIVEDIDQTALPEIGRAHV